MTKRSFLLLLLALFASTSASGQTGNGEADSPGNSQSTGRPNIMLRYDTLPPREYEVDGRGNHRLFRVIAPIDDLFDYRRPDYKGGFYIYYQTASLSSGEFKRKVSFDKAKQAPKTYIAHFAGSGSHDIGGGFAIPNYWVSYVEVPAGYDFNQFDPVRYDKQWQPYNTAWDMPQDLLMMTTLNLYTAAKRKEEEPLRDAAFQQAWHAEMQEAAEAASERCDPSLIARLKAAGQYDAIIRTGHSTLYVNTDMEQYEQPDDPAVFHIVYRKFHDNCAIKERRKFLPGVYAVQQLPVGMAAQYSPSGELADLQRGGFGIFPLPDQANVDFCIRLLEREGWIDRTTGKGKAVMEINQHIDPHAPSHGEPRLSIRAPWGIQADDSPGSSVGLLVRHDNRETVYIINKNGRQILDKFER